MIYTDGKGSLDEIKNSSPLKKGLKSNIYVANHFTMNDITAVGIDASFTGILGKEHRAFNPVCTSGVLTEECDNTNTQTLLSAHSDMTTFNQNNCTPTTCPGAPPSLGTGLDYLPEEAPTQPFYQFTCYDRMFDVKARIRVIVRSWDFRTSEIGKTSWSYSGGFESSFPSHKHDFGIFQDFTTGIAPSFGEGYPGANE